MKFKKLLATALSLAMVATTLTACGSDDSSSSKAGSEAQSGASGEHVTLQVLTHRTDIIESGLLDELTDEFEKANNCTIEYVGYTDYANDVATRLSTEDYGDVLMIPDSVKLSDLGNFFAPFGSYDEYKELYQCADSKMFDNTVYGLPTALNVAGGILYNKQVFADAGITELPRTPDEFIGCLEAIRDNCEGVIPYYTNYKDASWTITQWQGLVVSASGNPSYEIDLLTEKGDLFDADVDGYYTVYKMLFDIFSDPTLIEADPATTDWEACKPAFGEGKIGCMVLGSWAVGQFQEAAGDNAANVGFMPMPNEIDGKINAQISADYCMGVNKHSDNVELAQKFVKWYVGESGLQVKENVIPALIGADYPEFMDAFNDVNLFVATTAPAELTGVFNTIDKDSEVGTWDGDTANFKIKLAEAAFAGEGEEAFNKIIEEVNSKWAATRDTVLAD